MGEPRFTCSFFRRWTSGCPLSGHYEDVAVSIMHWFLCDPGLSFLLCIPQECNLWVTWSLCLMFWGAPRLFSEVAAALCTPSVYGVPDCPHPALGIVRLLTEGGRVTETSSAGSTRSGGLQAGCSGPQEQTGARGSAAGRILGPSSLLLAGDHLLLTLPTSSPASVARGPTARPSIALNTWRAWPSLPRSPLHTPGEGLLAWLRGCSPEPALCKHGCAHPPLSPLWKQGWWWSRSLRWP